MGKDCTGILKALSDPSRMRIVKALLAGSRSVNEIAETLALSQFNVSRHLRVLRRAGIVDVEPIGTRREYHIVPAFRERRQQKSNVLDFGCCNFRLNQVAD